VLAIAPASEAIVTGECLIQLLTVSAKNVSSKLTFLINRINFPIDSGRIEDNIESL
jgi:hypothetical protein